MNPLLTMRDICKSFPGVNALDHVTFHVGSGEIHGLVGENGAGKSTLIKILSGAHTATSGDIVIDGQVISNPSPRKMIDLGIAIIYQELTLAPHLSVAENIFMGRLPVNRLGLVDWRLLDRKTEKVGEQLGFALNPRQMVSELKLAQRQIVEIARALCANAKILVLDEPSAVLGDVELEGLFRVLKKLREQGVSIIYISHRLSEIFEITDRVTVLKDGVVVNTRNTGEIDANDLVKMMVGRELSDSYRQRGARCGKVALRVRGLRRKGVLRDISFHVREGEVLGLSGLVGAGRTEVLRAIVGADPIDGGTVELFGKPARIRTPREGIGQGLAILPEERKAEGLYLNQTVAFNLTNANLEKFMRFGLISLSKEKSACLGFIKALGVRPDNPNALIRNLSGGNQQKVVFARWLNAESKILLIDEPTRGVDVGAKAEIYRLIEEMAKNRAAIVVVSSDLPEILGVCDRTIVMREGEIMADLPIEQASEELIMQYATGQIKQTATVAEAEEEQS